MIEHAAHSFDDSEETDRDERGEDLEPRGEHEYDPEALLRTAFAACSDVRNAEDIASEAVLRFVTKYESKPTGSPHRLIQKIVDSLQIDRWRRAPVASERTIDPAEFEIRIPRCQAPDDVLLEKELIGVVKAAVADLPRTLRQVVELRVMQGVPAIEVAQEIGVSRRTVDDRVTKAIEKLRARFRSHGIGGVPVAQFIQQRVQLAPSPAAAAAGATTAFGTRVMLLGVALLFSLTGIAWFGSRTNAALDEQPVTLGTLLRQQSGASTEGGAASPRERLEAPRALEHTDAHSPERDIRSTAVDAKTDAGSTSPSDDLAPEEQTSASRRFQMRITVDGEASAGWKSTRPMLDPDAQRTAASEAIYCDERATTDPDGLAGFDLPPADGLWQFAFESPMTPLLSVWVLHDPTSLDGPLDIGMEMGELTIDDVPKTWPDADAGQLVLVCNPRPGVWILGMPEKTADGKGIRFPHVPEGHHELRTYTRAFDPDEWPQAKPAWSGYVSPMSR